MANEGNVSAQLDNDSEKVFTFPLGIPGFEKYTTYHVFHKEESATSAYWLESCEGPKVTFTLVDPTDYGLNFELELSDEEQDVLQADSHENIAVLLMLSKKESEEGAAGALNANIAGPILINLEKRLGIQKVITKSHVAVNIVQE